MGNTPTDFPSFVKPMMARLVERPPSDDNWLYEIKFDGFRALGLIRNGQARLLSRNEHELGKKFPEIRDALTQLNVHDAVLDGEIVALDAKGRSSFQLLQAYELDQEHPPIFYYLFDLLELNGKNLRALPLFERKAKLKKLLQGAPANLRYSAPLGSDAAFLLRQVKSLGLEGLIGKRADSVYEAGERSGSWIKLKLQKQQEFVIGGYTDPTGTRHHFGAVLVGFYDDACKLQFAGKVGTGFDAVLLKELLSKFSKISRKMCPFDQLSTKKTRYGDPVLSAAELRHCHWIEPKMVCQIKFSEWTQDYRLRQPVFMGIREDKDAEEVTFEQAAE